MGWTAEQRLLCYLPSAPHVASCAVKVGVLVAGGWRSTCIHVLLKPEGWFCFGARTALDLRF